jgi:hypothetical protein
MSRMAVPADTAAAAAMVDEISAGISRDRM